MDMEKFRREADKCAQMAVRQVAGSREREEWLRIGEAWRALAKNAASADTVCHEPTANGPGAMHKAATCARGTSDPVL